MSQKSPQQPIEAIDFTPLAEGGVGKQSSRINVATAIVAVLLFFCAIALWFLLSSRALVISVTPAEASIDISGGFSIRLSDSYLVRPGNYQVGVTAEGYMPHTQSVTIGEDDSQRLQISLQIKPGILLVDSTPDTVTVSLNDEVLGSAPGPIDNIPPGEHSFTFSHPRYKSATQTIAVRGKGLTEQVSIALMPAWGDIAIDSMPVGATVMVGETVVGNTPLKIEVLESGEQVSLNLPGYKTWQQTLSGVIGQNTTLQAIVLQPADAVVTIKTSPAGARVMLDNTFMGTTPLDIEVTPDQSHKLAVFQAGYENHNQSLTLKSGQEHSLDIKLKPQLGQIRIALSPANASLYIDGKLHKVTNGLLSLPAHPHQLEARLAGYVSQAKTVTPKPGVDQLVSLTLMTEEEAKRRQIPTQLKTAEGQQLKLFRPEGATFRMGSSRREQGRRANEAQKLVKLEKAFYLSLAPVSNRDYKRFNVRHSSSHANGNTLDLPDQAVVNITWEDAANYCNWLSEKEGLNPFYKNNGNKISGVNADANGYRLATEAEWAWAARYRSGTMKKFIWGNTFPPPTNSGNFADQRAATITGRTLAGYQDNFLVSAPLSKLTPDDQGLLSMGHNIAEWVNDFYDIQPGLGTQADVDPLGPVTGQHHVIRGASWRHGSITELRLSYRDYGDQKRDDVGFRLARYAR